MLKRMIAALSLAAATAMATTANAAVVACAVADPTDTPLNVRNAPNGTILGALNNDAMVMVKDIAQVNGRKWVKVMPLGPGKSGWVYFNYLNCEGD